MAGPIEQIKIDVNDLADQIASRLSVNTEYPRWLKLREAARYSAIGVNRLIALAEEGAIIGFQDHDDQRHPWIFDRLSLDAYREDQAGRIQAKFDRINERLGL